MGGFWILVCFQSLLLLCMAVLWLDVQSLFRRVRALTKAGAETADEAIKAAERTEKAARIAEEGELAARRWKQHVDHAEGRVHEDAVKAITAQAEAREAARRALEAADRAELGTPAGALLACRELVRSANALASTVSQIAEQVRRQDEAARAREKRNHQDTKKTPGTPPDSRV